MILRMPEYCRDFTCIADKCQDNCCCAGWEIDIDSETSEFYKSVSGEFGKRLSKNISYGDEACIIPDKNGKCPFLNDGNLCDIIINLGGDKLCSICDRHPRFFEWYNGFAEGGTGLCCEESARLIISYNGKFLVFDSETQDESADNYDKDLFAFMYYAREKMFTYLYDDSLSFSERICGIIDYADILQVQADKGKFTALEIKSNGKFENCDLKQIFDFLLTLESLNENWHFELIKMKEKLDVISGLKNQFLKGFPEAVKYLKNIMGYFLWRYFLRGVFDEEFLSAVKFSAVSTAVIGYIFAYKWYEKGRLDLESCIEAAKNYSKEIEYSVENVNAFLDAAYDNEAFLSLRIKGLFN
ncbi:MAG: hypothetical protein HFK00_01905 [Oscillospiraceae bacterium]|nr:hypothetical protein [Oscillospiraceae bacterium]